MSPTAPPPDPKWTALGSEPAYQGFLTIQSQRYRLPDGRVARWDILTGGPTVAVLALTTQGRVVLARQFRPGPGLVLDELPGGILDEGEEVAAAAARELVEETGYVPDRVQVVAATWLAGFSTIRRYAAVAHGCRRRSTPQPDGDEFCEPIEVDLAAFLQQVRRGELTDTDLAYLCLDHLGLLGAPATGPAPGPAGRPAGGTQGEIGVLPGS